jgi:hypothetical protein
MTAQGKGPDGSVWLEDANTVPAPDSDERSHCFRLTTPRKTLQLSASGNPLSARLSPLRSVLIASDSLITLPCRRSIKVELDSSHR